MIWGYASTKRLRTPVIRNILTESKQTGVIKVENCKLMTRSKLFIRN
jgi:hypothetical protein